MQRKTEFKHKVLHHAGSTQEYTERHLKLQQASPRSTHIQEERLSYNKWQTQTLYASKTTSMKMNISLVYYVDKPQHPWLRLTWSDS